MYWTLDPGSFHGEKGLPLGARSLMYAAPIRGTADRHRIAVYVSGAGDWNVYGVAVHQGDITEIVM